ncbi:hypothetical protein [Hymenobacter canadensis]|uniref:Anti-sigma factor n=1 Tax=Hymenobacter canadensis TaxID=2999067 RepID=A0ABY7LM29_9BACT|nr:hypothetical protein [Hymenobacter canadensis]WBA40516.1 hypothetical protein O3303_11820 [Hymenobacter canadensis]
MNNKETGLENFVERHRADFDVFEPRPDLWDAIEAQLTDSAAAPATAAPDEEPAPLRVVRMHPAAEASTTPTLAARPATWWPRPAMAAATAALLLAGLGAIWSNDNSHSGAWTASSAAVAPLASAPAAETSAGLSFGFEAEPVAAAASASSTQRLAQEVRRMESYFAVQINERQAQLQKLEATMPMAGAADWQRELAGLDSTYRQLKQELYRNPEPTVVLDAMNRNLQIRLDILNQQTRTREQMQEYHSQAAPAASNQPQP